MKNFLIILVLAITLSIILSWPLAANLTSYYEDAGDYATHGSIFWYNQDSIKTGRIFNQVEYFKGYQFYPHPYSLAFANNHVFPSLIFSPWYWLTNSLPFSLNVYTFLTFVFSFIACFYFINYFVKDPLASLIGSFIFTFNPQTMSRFPQHIELLGKYFLPLIFLFAYKLLHKPNFKDAFWLFLFITLNSLTANYFQIFTYVLLPIAALSFIWTNVWCRNWPYFLNLAKVSLLGLIFVPVLLYFNLPFWEFSQKEGAFRSVSETVFFSARITDWFASTPNNLIYGSWTKYLEKFRQPKDDRGILNYEEHTLFISLLATILFFIGLKYFRKQELNRSFFLILLLASFIFSFGPYFNGAEGTIKLPFYYLHEAIPIMKGIRAPSRFEYILLIPFVLTASFAVKRFLKKYHKYSKYIFFGFLIILILENFNFRQFDAKSRILKKVNQLSSRLDFLQNSITLHLPVFTIADADIFGKNSIYLNWLTKTHETVVNGNSGYFPPDILALLFEANDNLEENTLQKLATLGINYLIIHKDLMTDQELNRINQSRGLLSQGKIFDLEGIEVIDIAKYNFKTPTCILERDFNFKLSKEAEIDSEKDAYALVLTNTQDCLLVSIYNDRYRKIPVEVNGAKKQAYFKVPILIGPKEQIVLSELDHQLRIR